MPLLRVTRNTPRVAHASSANTLGVTSNAHHWDCANNQRKPADAELLALVNAMAASATSTAPTHRARRRRHSSRENSGGGWVGSGSGMARYCHMGTDRKRVR